MPRLGFDLAVVSEPPGPKDTLVNKRWTSFEKFPLSELVGIFKVVPAEFFKRNLISLISRPCSQTTLNKGDVPRQVLFKSIFFVAECCINDFMTP